MRPELSAVAESPLVQIATAAEAMPGSIKLCYGESDMPTADFICRAANRRVIPPVSVVKAGLPLVMAVLDRYTDAAGSVGRSRSTTM